MTEMFEMLDFLNGHIEDMIKIRNKVLRTIRKQCKHLRLAELNEGPPRRICADCGAEECGWGCGYHILAMNGDPHEVPHKKDRSLLLVTKDCSKFFSFRKKGPIYLVGQSHPNFSGGGIKTYEQL